MYMYMFISISIPMVQTNKKKKKLSYYINVTPSVVDRSQLNYFQQVILKQVIIEDQNTNAFSKNNGTY